MRYQGVGVKAPINILNIKGNVCGKNAGYNIRDRMN
jgi:hypothetical protein